MYKPAKWTEYWKYSCTDVGAEMKQLEAERYKNNQVKSIKISRAMLAFSIAKTKEFKRFLERFPVDFSPEETLEINDAITSIDLKLKNLAYKEAARRGGDLALALVAGMRRMSIDDFVDLSAQALFWFLYRLSPYASSGHSCPLVAWASSFNRIAYEATCTGPSNQKNKIVLYSLEQSDKFWKGCYGTKELLDVSALAEEAGLDIAEAVWSVAIMTKNAMASVELKENITKADYLLVDRMFLDGQTDSFEETARKPSAPYRPATKPSVKKGRISLDQEITNTSRII